MIDPNPVVRDLIHLAALAPNDIHFAQFLNNETIVMPYSAFPIHSLREPEFPEAQARILGGIQTSLHAMAIRYRIPVVIASDGTGQVFCARVGDVPGQSSPDPAVAMLSAFVKYLEYQENRKDAKRYNRPIKRQP